MKSTFYTLALLIVAYWALGTFAWSLGPIVHALLLVALLVVLVGNNFKNGVYR